MAALGGPSNELALVTLPSLAKISAAGSAVGAVLGAVVALGKTYEEAVVLEPTPHSRILHALAEQKAESQARAEVAQMQASEMQMRALRAAARANYFAALRLSVQAQVDYQAWLAAQSPSAKAAAAESAGVDAPDEARGPNANPSTEESSSGKAVNDQARPPSAR